MEEIIKRKIECFRCGYIWKTKLVKLPVFCSRCKSPSWNKPRERKLFNIVEHPIKHKKKKLITIKNCELKEDSNSN